MEGARHLALAVALAWIAQVDEGHVGAAVQLARLLHAQGLDLALGVGEQRLVSGGNGLRHSGLLATGLAYGVVASPRARQHVGKGHRLCRSPCPISSPLPGSSQPGAATRSCSNMYRTSARG